MSPLRKFGHVDHHLVQENEDWAGGKDRFQLGFAGRPLGIVRRSQDFQAFLLPQLVEDFAPEALNLPGAVDGKNRLPRPCWRPLPLP